jgi:Fe-S-cluster containining protein
MPEFSEACKGLVDSKICRGDCCGVVPFPRGFLDEHREATAVDVRVVIPEGEFELILGHDKTCVFCHRETGLCNVYDQRPQLCRIFGVGEDLYLQCPWLVPDGTRRSRARRRRLARHMEAAMRDSYIALLTESRR